MKARVQNLIRLLVGMTVIGWELVGQVRAQTFTAMHNFAATSTNLSGYYTNSDGALPFGGLLLSGDTLYGTTLYGGNSGNGTVFKINIEGLGLTTLHSFDTWSLWTNNFGIWTNADGAQPMGSLVSSGTTIYGATSEGGSFGSGTIFAINKDGTGFTNLHIFEACTLTNCDDGASPSAGPILSDNALYGTTQNGGDWLSGGTVFKLNTNGTAFTVLHVFPDSGDGAGPEAELISAGNTLYGTTARGIDSVFAINPDGSGYRRLHDFAPATSDNGSFLTNSDGLSPQSSMILSANILYGTAKWAGNFGFGTVFALKNDGSGFTNLHNFTGGNDGANPHGALVLLGHVLYGASELGGSSNCGTVFAIDTNGTNFRTLHSFSGIDGCQPMGGLILSGHVLYGTTCFGGVYDSGTVFAISLLQPQLAIVPFGSNLLLSWPTNFTGYTLQSATDLNSPIWTTNLPAPAVVNGQYTVTNPISGTQQFFKLSQ
jgi:uncharacterized repeat protein (TIGR03803 family)